jgi:hypothetical protein
MQHTPPMHQIPRPPYLCRQRQLTSWMLYFIMAAHVALFIVAVYFNSWQLEELSKNPLLGPGQAALLKIGATATNEISNKHEYWRLLVSPFLGAGALHVWANMVTIFTFGMFLANQLSVLQIGKPASRSVAWNGSWAEWEGGQWELQPTPSLHRRPEPYTARPCLPLQLSCTSPLAWHPSQSAQTLAPAMLRPPGRGRPLALSGVPARCSCSGSGGSGESDGIYTLPGHLSQGSSITGSGNRNPHSHPARRWPFPLAQEPPLDLAPHGLLPRGALLHRGHALCRQLREHSRLCGRMADGRRHALP